MAAARNERCGGRTVRRGEAGEGQIPPACEHRWWPETVERLHGLDDQHQEVHQLHGRLLFLRIDRIPRACRGGLTPGLPSVRLAARTCGYVARSSRQHTNLPC